MLLHQRVEGPILHMACRRTVSSDAPTVLCFPSLRGSIVAERRDGDIRLPLFVSLLLAVGIVPASMAAGGLPLGLGVLDELRAVAILIMYYRSRYGTYI